MNDEQLEKHKTSQDDEQYEEDEWQEILLRMLTARRASAIGKRAAGKGRCSGLGKNEGHSCGGAPGQQRLHLWMFWIANSEGVLISRAGLYGVAERRNRSAAISAARL